MYQVFYFVTSEQLCGKQHVHKINQIEFIINHIYVIKGKKRCFFYMYGSLNKMITKANIPLI